jgi:hypothetical protein
MPRGDSPLLALVRVSIVELLDQLTHTRVSMDITLKIALITGCAALFGGLLASITPAVVTYLNGRAETHRERLRLAAQLALAEHEHLMKQAPIVAKQTGQVVPVAPIAATFVYHLQLLDLVNESLEVNPQDLVILRKHNKYVLDALIANDPNAPARE